MTELPPELRLWNLLRGALITRALDVQPGSELLDVPCGAGRLSVALAASGFRVTGVDLSPAFLDRARAASAGKTSTVTQRKDPGHSDGIGPAGRTKCP